MFLRATKRFKDGKVHYYWSMVENVRVGRRVFQRQALYLGELNDSQREEWQRAIEAFDEKGNVRQLKLFPEDRAPETDDGQVVRIRMDRLTVRNVRNWGEAWLGLELWAGHFGSTCDVVLFDLTSTYFEVDGTKALESDLQRYGYSRDKRGDCLQVVVALVLTPRQIVDKFRAVKMVDVVMPTTDGRIITLPRDVEPKPDLSVLLDRLGLTLPAQPPPKISSEAADAAKSTV